MRRLAYVAAVGGLLALAGPALAQAQTVVVLTPPTATNPVGTEHTVTATVTTAGQPAAGVVVRFTVTGASAPFDPGGFCTTNANGQCSFTYRGQAAGVDVITGCADLDGSGTVDPGEPCGTATKVWVGGSPAPCPDDDEDDAVGSGETGADLLATGGAQPGRDGAGTASEGSAGDDDDPCGSDDGQGEDG